MGGGRFSLGTTPALPNNGFSNHVEDVSKAAAAAITAKHSRLNSTVWIISIGSDDSAKWRGLPRDHPAVLIVADLVLPFQRALKSMT